MFKCRFKPVYTYIVAFLCAAPACTWADTPQVQTSSAYIQLFSVLDGTQTDIVIPGLPDAKRHILGLVSQNAPNAASAWLEAGVPLEGDDAPMQCVDFPEDFLIEDRGDSWLYRDIRTISCEWHSQTFSLQIEVLQEEKAGQGTWINTEIQSVY